jgi:hypothetical protein
MSFTTVEKIADAVLFEGYILYPYRASAIKNRQRWNFGTLFPRAFAEAQTSAESWSFHAEVLVQTHPKASAEQTSSAQAAIDARVRFLQLVPSSKSEKNAWEEGFARSRTVAPICLEHLCHGFEYQFDLSSLSGEEIDPAPVAFSAPGCLGILALRADRLSGELFRLSIDFRNETPIENPDQLSRVQALSLAFTSAHLLLHATNASFVSVLDPQPQFAELVASCANRGVFPVLTGEQGESSCMLLSPIILYDYPQIAPESAGDFFDGTEMDEMLALRVMTLTEAEQEEMRRGDQHARAILERLETLPQEHLLRVHGAVRGMRPVSKIEIENPDRAVQLWNPFDEPPALESVCVFGVELRKGDRVRLWPQKRADIMDMAMNGKVAVIEAIEQDLEDNIQFAVVLDDDPGRDMGMMCQAGHRFFFSPHEVEPLGPEAP